MKGCLALGAVLALVVAGFAFPMYSGDLLAGIVGTGVALVVTAVVFDKLRVKDGLATMALLLIFAGFMAHVVMTFATAPLKTEFARVADTSPNRQVTIEPVEFWQEEAVTRLEYNGRLDAVVAKRTRWLADRGFVYVVGGWHTSDTGSSAAGWYLWVGPFARR